MTKEPVSVYNFKVEDYHTYFVGGIGVWVHNPECVVHKNGEIEITDWEGYPENAPKPEGKLKLLEGDDYAAARKKANAANRKLHREHPELKGKDIHEGDDYAAARKKANAANRKLHREHPELKGKDIHEIHPVKFSGSPTDVSNKIALSRTDHSKFTTFWNAIRDQVNEQRS